MDLLSVCSSNSLPAVIRSITPVHSSSPTTQNFWLSSTKIKNWNIIWNENKFSSPFTGVRNAHHTGCFPTNIAVITDNTGALEIKYNHKTGTWKYIKTQLSLSVSPVYRKPQISWLYLPSKYLNRKIRIKTTELMAVFSLFSRYKFKNKFSQVLTRKQLNLSIIWSYHSIEDGFQSEVENVRLTAIN